jgi:cullin 1
MSSFNRCSATSISQRGALTSKSVLWVCIAGAHLMGSDLYNKLSDYLKTHLARLRTVSRSRLRRLRIFNANAYPVSYFESTSFAQESENLSDLALLQFYTKEWKRYTTGANYVNRLFAYLNRHWVKREKDEGRKGIYTVYTVSPRNSQCEQRRCERLTLSEEIRNSYRSSSGKNTSS